MEKPFLEAEWRKLIMVNYSVDQKILEPYLPARTEIELWSNTCYVSLVGFMFLNTRLKGFKIPFHTDFAEVNLRFYVRHKDGVNWRRGVVFIKEIVPKAALTWVANTMYGEHYETMPMKHEWAFDRGELSVQYIWKKKRWHSIKVKASQMGNEVLRGSEEEFITEHFWGYTKVGPVKTAEYQVEHPAWKVYPTKDYMIDVDFGNVYGHDFDFLSSQIPQSVFLAEGSEITVNKTRAI
ncbi:MAG: DUF2071 domain-containing protein [Saprospiraceae bacterium]|nr:DUF2071 domain-containing protein [Saprospiraceae bacterium]